MNTTLLYHKAGAVSGPRLAKYLGIEASQSGNFDERPPYLIRYGSKKRVSLRPEIRTINRRRMLARHSNRLQQLQRLRAAGVRVPNFSDGALSLHRGHGVLARAFGESGQATGGEGITYFPLKPGTALPKVGDSWDFFTAYIPKDRQFRVHVIGGNTRTRELIPDEDEHRDKIIWNYDAGFTFRVPEGGTEGIPLQVVPAAVQAVKALWLDFGAVDVITRDGVAYVLEVNTAPGLADPTLEWYGETFGKLMGLSEIPGWEAEGLDKEGEDATED